MTDYTAPTPAQVRAFLKTNNLTGTAAADLAGLSDSAQIRKYTGGAKPHRMSYAIWFALHAKTMLTDDDIARIHAAMDADAEGPNPEIPCL